MTHLSSLPRHRVKGMEYFAFYHESRHISVENVVEKQNLFGRRKLLWGGHYSINNWQTASFLGCSTTQYQNLGGGLKDHKNMVELSLQIQSLSQVCLCPMDPNDILLSSYVTHVWNINLNC